MLKWRVAWKKPPAPFPCACFPRFSPICPWSHHSITLSQGRRSSGLIIWRIYCNRHRVEWKLEGLQDLVTPGANGRAVAWASRSAVVWENALSHRANIANTLLSLQCRCAAERQINGIGVEARSAWRSETFACFLIVNVHLIQWYRTTHRASF